MFKQPLTSLQNTQQINPSLLNARLPEQWTHRFGQSVSTIANNADMIGWEAPSPKLYRIDETSKKFRKYSNNETVENIYTQQFGNTVEFLSAYLTLGKDEAEVIYFPQACDHIDDLYYDDPLHPREQSGVLKGRKDPTKRKQWEQLSEERQEMIIKDLARLSDLLDRIDADPMSLDGITAACEFIAFDNTMKGGRKRYPSDGKAPEPFKGTVIPNIDCARRIYQMVKRNVYCLEQYAPVQSYQFSYPFSILESHENGVNGGRLDFVAKNMILDCKTDAKYKVSNSNRLQTLIYLALMQRVNTKNPVKFAGVINVRENILEGYIWDELDEKTKSRLNAIIDYRKWDEYQDRVKNSPINKSIRNELKRLLEV